MNLKNLKSGNGNQKIIRVDFFRVGNVFVADGTAIFSQSASEAFVLVFSMGSYVHLFLFCVYYPPEFLGSSCSFFLPFPQVLCFIRRMLCFSDDKKNRDGTNTTTRQQQSSTKVITQLQSNQKKNYDNWTERTEIAKHNDLPLQGSTQWISAERARFSLGTRRMKSQSLAMEFSQF